MNNYKVQFTKTYVIDVVAHNEEEATVKARGELTQKQYLGIDHFNETDEDIVVFDVTDTEDPFDPEN